MNENQRKERMKDRQAARQSLINRRNEIDVKLARVEEEIKKLREG